MTGQDIENIMNKEAQRIAIAEFCGWIAIETRQANHIIALKADHALGSRNVTSDFCEYAGIPQYLHDLNAMHDAESHLIQSTRLWAEYVMQLKHEVVGRYPLNDLRSTDPAIAIHATAAQRAEALLRTIGKWVD